MKKLGLFVLAALTVGFTACKKDNAVTPDLDNVVSDGMYVLGEAVGVTDINNAADLLMCQGVNEHLMDAGGKTWEEAKRKGMFEKYLYLEGNKNFRLAYLDGELLTYYGGNLVAHDITADLGQVSGYWCALDKDIQYMQVPETGFYHIVLDLNQNEGDLDAAGGAQIIVAPVKWGISGGMNGWGMTEGVKGGDQKLTTWTWENLEIPAGTEFKFKDAHCGWKIWLDGETQQVSANSNLGAEMKQGGANIKVEEGAVYNLILSWKLAKGDMANSYTMELKKVGDLVLNPADFVVGISGSMQGWADPAGVFAAKLDADATTVTDPATKAGTYVYKMEGVTFPAESEFKFRFNGNWLGIGAVELEGVAPATGDEGANFAGVEGTYDIVITAVWDGAQATSLKAVFTEGVPSERVDIAISAIVPEGWEHCYLWAWDANGDNYTGGVWPGEELEIKDGKVAKAFVQVVAPLNVIFSNGDGVQTNDITDVKDGAEIDIQANLK